MIKNIIFDLSGVLLKYDIPKFLTSIGIRQEEQEIYQKLIWNSEEWLQGDRGEITYEEIISSLANRYPEYNQIRYILEHKDNDILLSAMTESIDCIKELKDKGYKIYFLSNVNAWDIAYNIKRFDFFKLADGTLYSCDIKTIKPEKECFYALLDKYNLKLEESIFIDDTKANVEAANEIGLKSILFDNITNVKAKINQILSCQKN